MKARRHNLLKTGFTLTEVMFSLLIGGWITIAAIALFIMHSGAYRNQNQMRDLEQNLRFALDSISRDVRMAGYGLPVNPTALTNWLPWAGTMTSNPYVVEGASSSAPDALLLAAAIDVPIAFLAQDATNGVTSLTLESGEGSGFDTSTRSVVFIGRVEPARVLAVSGDTLTISTDPVAVGSGLAYAHPAGTPIELVHVIRYQWNDTTNAYVHVPYIERTDLTASMAQSWYNLTASQIETLAFSNIVYKTSVFLAGQTEALLAHDPAGGDGYGHMALQGTVIPRNSPLLRYRSLGGR